MQKSFFLFLVMPVMGAVTLPTEPNFCSKLEQVSTTQFSFNWEGEEGWSYIMQYSSDLENWSYLGAVDNGTGNFDYTINFDDGSGNIADKTFMRLVTTDFPVESKAAAEIADFDGDGIGNLAELSLLGTDPLLKDTDGNGTDDGAEDSDGNGLGDGWEFVHFGTIGQSASADPDNDGLSNEEEYEMGSNPTNGTFLGTNGSEYYKYDDLGRLTRVQGESEHCYLYDPSGNIEEAH